MIRNTIAIEARKEGLAEGRAEGRVEGHTEGVGQGREEKSMEIVINLFNYGMNIEDIALNTNMSCNNVKNIINSIKNEE